MDHAYIEKHGLIELYHQGALPPDEEARFEAHFVDCPRCIEELEAARGLRTGLRAMAAEDAARVEVVRVGILAGIAQLLRRPPVAVLFAGALAAITAAGFWLGNEIRGLRETAELARAEAGGWQARYEGELENVRELERRLTKAEASGGADATELDDLRTRLEEATAARDQSARELERFRTPHWDTRVFILTVVRSGDEPAAIIDPGETGEWISLAVDVDIDPRISSYRVEIAGWPDKRLWRRDGLQPNAFETLMITFPASYFSAGNYELTVQGLLAEGGTVEINRFDFQVISQD